MLPGVNLQRFGHSALLFDREKPTKNKTIGSGQVYVLWTATKAFWIEESFLSKVDQIESTPIQIE